MRAQAADTRHGADVVGRDALPRRHRGAGQAKLFGDARHQAAGLPEDRDRLLTLCHAPLLSTTEQSGARPTSSATKQALRHPAGMRIGDLIRTERARLRWTQRALAKQLGVSPGAVAQWETGDTRPTLANAINFCALAAIDASVLFGPGGDYAGQLVEDPDELALITAWRTLPAEDRAGVLRLIRNAGAGSAMPVGAQIVPLESVRRNPKPSRK